MRREISTWGTLMNHKQKEGVIMYHLYCLSFFLLLLSCGNPQQDQIIEVTRLDILRKKTQEILTEQKIRVGISSKRI